MARPDTHRSQAKSLFKKGLITEKQHDRMLTRIAAMAPPSPENAPSAAPADPSVAGAAQVPAASPLPVTVSVPGGGQQNPATAQMPA